MTKFKHPLNSVKIASPCSAEWERMIGNDRRRFCGQCELNVYNLSDMTKREAEDLINRSEGRLCVRFYKRNDGTILTRDCPIGLKAMKRRLSLIAKATLSTAIGFLSGLGLYGVLEEPVRHTTMGVMVQDSPGGNRVLISDEMIVPQGRLVMARDPQVLGGLAAEPIKPRRNRNSKPRSVK